MATKTLSRVEAARAELAEATSALDALRQQHLADDSVTAEEFSHAGSRLELAEIAVRGAEEAAAEKAAAERRAALRRLRTEIEASADPEAAYKAFAAAETAITELVRQIGPDRNRRLNWFLGEIRKLDVPATPANEVPSESDAGLGWQGPSMTHGSPVIRLKERAIGPLVLSAVIAGAVSRACTAAGRILLSLTHRMLIRRSCATPGNGFNDMSRDAVTPAIAAAMTPGVESLVNDARSEEIDGALREIGVRRRMRSLELAIRAGVIKGKDN